MIESERQRFIVKRAKPFFDAIAAANQIASAFESNQIAYTIKCKSCHRVQNYLNFPLHCKSSLKRHKYCYTCQTTRVTPSMKSTVRAYYMALTAYFLQLDLSCVCELFEMAQRCRRIRLMRQYQIQHADALRAYRLKYLRAHRTHTNNKQKEWNAKNREKRQAYNQTWYQLNKRRTHACGQK